MVANFNGFQQLLIGIASMILKLPGHCLERQLRNPDNMILKQVPSMMSTLVSKTLNGLLNQLLVQVGVHQLAMVCLGLPDDQPLPGHNGYRLW